MITGRPIYHRKDSNELLFRFAPYIIGFLLLAIVPIFLPAYVQNLMTKILIFSIFAMSLDIILGYTGLPSLGHAAFLGVAGYTVTILLVIHGIDNFYLIAALGIFLAVLTAAILGVLALRASGIFFLLVTFALGMLIYSIALKFNWLTRGQQGLPLGAYPNLGLPGIELNSFTFYFFVFLVFIVCFFLMYRITKSPFGLTLQGIRENESRMRMLGYNTWRYKYIAFIISGLFAGIAGVLFPFYSGGMVPQNLDINTSAYALLICIIGGVGTLWGSIFGAVVLIFLEFFIGNFAPYRWPLILGIIFVLAVIFLRGGIAAHISRLWRRLFIGSVKS